jgi:hypothetical protein
VPARTQSGIPDRRHLAGLARAAATATAFLAAGCGGHTGHAPSRTLTASATVTTISSPDRAVTIPQAPPAPRLVFMYQLQPRDQLYQTLTVDTNGGGSVGYFIGETTGVKRNYFRVGAAVLGRLRRELTGLAGVRTERLGGPTTVVYTIIAGNRSVRVTQGRVPRRIAPLVGDLSGLVSRYEP